MTAPVSLFPQEAQGVAASPRTRRLEANIPNRIARLVTEAVPGSVSWFGFMTLRVMVVFRRFEDALGPSLECRSDLSRTVAKPQTSFHRPSGPHRP